jgi:hypothetical protein
MFLSICLKGLTPHKIAFLIRRGLRNGCGSARTRGIAVNWMRVEAITMSFPVRPFVFS